MRTANAEQRTAAGRDATHNSLPRYGWAFVRQEPAGFQAGDANLYRYVGNDPTTRRGCKVYKLGRSRGSLTKEWANRLTTGCSARQQS